MNKLFLSICAVVLIAVCLCVGGVFGAFFYYTQVTEPKTDNVSTTMAAFVYSEFTQEMTTLINYVDGSKTSGLNMQSYYSQDGALFAYMSISPYRSSYGYFGSMDTTPINGTTIKGTVSSHFGADESVSFVMRLVIDEGTSEEPKYVAYMYIASAQDVNNAQADVDTITVFRVAYELDTTGAYLLRKDENDNPVIEKGTSLVKTYEGQTPDTNSFGVYNNTEIFVKDAD